jgi:hypothetical protein
VPYRTYELAVTVLLPEGTNFTGIVPRLAKVDVIAGPLSGRAADPDNLHRARHPGREDLRGRRLGPPRGQLPVRVQGRRPPKEGPCATPAGSPSGRSPSPQRP